LKDYDYSSDGYYFVTICCSGRRPYCKDKETAKIVAAEQALQLQRLRGAGGRFWQPNYYEHVIRNEKALHSPRPLCV